MAEKTRSVYGRQQHHSNSVAALINTGDKEFLAKIGMTKEEAKRKLKEYLKETATDNASMERWYRIVGPLNQKQGEGKW